MPRAPSLSIPASVTSSSAIASGMPTGLSNAHDIMLRGPLLQQRDELAAGRKVRPDHLQALLPRQHPPNLNLPTVRGPTPDRTPVAPVIVASPLGSACWRFACAAVAVR